MKNQPAYQKYSETTIEVVSKVTLSKIAFIQ